MRPFLLLLALPLAACGSDSDPAPTDSGPPTTDSGGTDSGSGDTDAGDTDAGSSGDDAGGMDAGDLDAGAMDAGFDAGFDAGAMDAGPPNVLYATIAGDLVTIDTATGLSTRVGTTFINPVTRLAYDADADVIYGIAGNPGPRVTLVSMDRCTGRATSVTRITHPNNFIDAFSWNPADMTMYVSVSADGAFPGDASAETLATLDTTTGITTTVGVVPPLADIDQLLLDHTPALAIDGVPMTDQHVLFDVNVATPAVTNMRAGGAPRVGRLAVHGGVIYGLVLSGATRGQIVTLDPTTAATTLIGGSHVTTDFRAMVSAPACVP